MDCLLAVRLNESPAKRLFNRLQLRVHENVLVITAGAREGHSNVLDGQVKPLTAFTTQLDDRAKRYLHAVIVMNAPAIAQSGEQPYTALFTEKFLHRRSEQ
jgi:hypothetical protein